MNVVLIILVSAVIIIDFIKLKKDNNKKILIYMAINIAAIIIAIADRYELFMASPLEVLIEKMMPITKAIESGLK